MNFRNSDGSLNLGALSEVWVEYEMTSIVGVVIKDGDAYYFSAYDNTGDHGPLYLFSFVDEQVLQDIRNGRIELLEGFSHYSAFIFKEFVQEDGSIIAKEVAFNELDEDELPESATYVIGV